MLRNFVDVFVELYSSVQRLPDPPQADTVEAESPERSEDLQRTAGTEDWICTGYNSP